MIRPPLRCRSEFHWNPIIFNHLEKAEESPGKIWKFLKFDTESARNIFATQRTGHTKQLESKCKHMLQHFDIVLICI
ncbi:hypothetical protein X798_01782 [Onchocerca flexuosa]|uniref:Uncharacterized protein n=1 Tax=Onchocerca flexuosa TaxID=387005 RepID=A0A238C2J6_9BILA|nr:hypothetical protein X798_01782 [Onchocerca flexuosa]